MTINPVFDGGKDYQNNKPDKIGPPAIIPRTVSLANHQVSLIFEMFLHLTKLHFALPF